MDEPNIVETLLPAVKYAGQEIIKIYKLKPTRLIKNDGSPVTIADKAAEKILIDTLIECFPKVPIVSEENPKSHNLKAPKEFFLVDPLDGTKEFLKFDGKGSFTVNVALIRNGIPVLGIVYAPALDRLFYGTQANGSFEENKNQIEKIEIRKLIKNSIVAVASTSHRDDETNNWLAQNNVSETVSIGSSLKFCLVACGEADVYPRFGPTMEWDTAAGDAVLRFAGGRVENLDGSVFKYGKKDYKNISFIAKGSF